MAGLAALAIQKRHSGASPHTGAYRRSGAPALDCRSIGAPEVAARTVYGLGIASVLGHLSGILCRVSEFPCFRNLL